MAAITKKSTIGEVLARDMQTAKYFMEIGMHCLGCPASQGESIEEACMVHGTNADELVSKLNAFFSEN
jgi:hybrid cluster-associated redox disulfide protein